MGRLVTVGVVVLVACRVFAADLPTIEEALRQAAADQRATADQRSVLVAQAGALADEIAGLKERSGPTLRAGRGLEDAMKRFDRVAARLDEIDKKAAEQGRAIASLRRRFEDAASAEVSRLQGAIPSEKTTELARALQGVDDARRRVARLAEGEPRFRPALEVSLTPADGRQEIRQKLLVLDAEYERVHARIAALDEESRVLEARVSLKRQLLSDLQAASKTAGPDLALIRREADELTSSLGDLTTQQETIAKDRLDLSRTLAQLAQRREEGGARLKSLEAKEDSR